MFQKEFKASIGIVKSHNLKSSVNLRPRVILLTWHNTNRDVADEKQILRSLPEGDKLCTATCTQIKKNLKSVWQSLTY